MGISEGDFLRKSFLLTSFIKKHMNSKRDFQISKSYSRLEIGRSPHCDKPRHNKIF